MSILNTEEIVARTRELEKMFPGLKEAWDSCYDSEFAWKEVTSDYEAYRTFTLLVGDTV